MERDRSGKFLKASKTKKQITIQLPEEQIQELDSYSKFNGISRNQVLSKAIKLLIEFEEEQIPMEERVYLTDAEMCERYGVDYSVVERWREGERAGYHRNNWDVIKNGWLSK